jgi:SAGA-associated factor 73
MAANGDSGKGAGSLVDASGYKYSDKDTKQGKIKLKKAAKLGGKKKNDGITLPILHFSSS